MNDLSPMLSGLWIPLITPFNHGRLDLSSLERLVAHYVDQPVDGFIVAATTGEGLTLDVDETADLAANVAAAVDRRIPLYLGLSGSNTIALVSTIEATGEWPIDGYLISCPYYSRPSQAGLLAHFTALAGATGRRVALYNIPYRTGVNLVNDTVLALADIPNIVGLKDCCADPAQTFDLLCRKPPSFSLLTGEDRHYYDALVHGAEGAVLASAHVETRRFASVRQRLADGDQSGSLRQWAELAPLVRLLFAEPSPAAIKYWLWRDGLIDSPEVRLPMTEVSRDLARRIDAERAAAQIRMADRVA